MTCTFSPQVLRATRTEVDVLLPVSGISITFRCGSRDAPVAGNLIQVSCMQNKCVLWEPMQFSRGAWLSARSTGASAIAEKRKVENTERRRVGFLPFQLSFQFF